MTNGKFPIILRYRLVVILGDDFMKKRSTNKKYGLRRLACVLCTAFLLGIPYSSAVQAEEPSGYFDEDGNWVQENAEDMTTDVLVIGDGEAVQEPLTGSYSMESGWVADDAASTEEKTVYKQEAYAAEAETSTITCSYMDTNYSVLEYELLRDMLTNNLLYNNVNAKISTSAVYTKAKDYLYILIVDDSAQTYRSIYHYVVGDYRCFCVQVKEYRAEADQAKAQDQKTPQEVGQTVAEEFTWNIQW